MSPLWIVALIASLSTWSILGPLWLLSGLPSKFLNQMTWRHIFLIGPVAWCLGAGVVLYIISLGFIAMYEETMDAINAWSIRPVEDVIRGYRDWGEI